MLVEIWSDIACPWCYIGKRRFGAALAQFEHRDEVTVAWRSFELDPGAPDAREGRYVDHLARKYGRSEEEAQAMLDGMTATAAAEGVTIDFARVRAGRTLDAHRLIALAAAHGGAAQAAERLFAAYFAEGVSLSDHDALAQIGAELGLPADETAELLATERYLEEVRDDEALAASAGIHAVPCFVIDRRIGASGARAPADLLAFLEAGWEQRALSAG
jgi:predicted DsbA family dithiol-disulfide isomerase